MEDRMVYNMHVYWMAQLREVQPENHQKGIRIDGKTHARELRPRKGTECLPDIATSAARKEKVAIPTTRTSTASWSSPKPLESPKSSRMS